MGSCCRGSRPSRRGGGPLETLGFTSPIPHSEERGRANFDLEASVGSWRSLADGFLVVEVQLVQQSREPRARRCRAGRDQAGRRTIARMIKEDLFEYMANEPAAWFGNADTLLKSAAKVWAGRERNPPSVWVALMLRGYAVEDLLKGLWLEAGNRLSSGGKFQPVPSVGDHDLLALYEKLGFSPGSSRRDMLRSLSNAIRHLGRYPVPKNYQQFAVHSEKKSDATALWSPDYEADFWELVRELGSKFEFMKQLPADFLKQVETQTWRT